MVQRSAVRGDKGTENAFWGVDVRDDFDTVYQGQTPPSRARRTLVTSNKLDCTLYHLMQCASVPHQYSNPPSHTASRILHTASFGHYLTTCG